MPFPDVLAGGITAVGRYDPSGPYLGGGDTSAMQVADGVAISQWQVCTYNASGRVIPYTGGGDFAGGTLTFNANPTNGQTLTINGQAITFVTSGATGSQVNIGTTTAATAQSTKALINANTAYGVGASGDANVLTLMALAAGAAGNSVTLAISGTNPALSGATLTGGGTSEGIPEGDPALIAAHAMAATTPGKYAPFFISGRFDHTQLIWPPGMENPAVRRSAFAGTPFNIYTML